MSSADARQEAVANMIGKITQALNCTPGRVAPPFNASEYEVPDKVTVEFSVAKYGFGDNVW
jgi:peptidase E